MKILIAFLFFFLYQGFEPLFAYPDHSPDPIAASTFSCPAVITPVGPLCDGAADIQLSASPAGGTWSGPGIVTSYGVFRPGWANIGNNVITFNSSVCGTSTTITIVVNCCMQMSSNDLYVTMVSCNGGNDGNIVFDNHSLLGLEPYNYNWDFLGTPEDDIYYNENISYLDSLSSGTYNLIITDQNGCTNSASKFIEDGQPILITSQVTYPSYPNFLGNINILTVTGPPQMSLITYDWDYSETPNNDDFDQPPLQVGDDQDINNLSPGNYTVTITCVDDPYFPSAICTKTFSFHLTYSNLWKGKISTEWENVINWTNNTLPDAFTDVTIPFPSNFYPEVHSNAICSKLTIQPGATVNVVTGYQLNVLK